MIKFFAVFVILSFAAPPAIARVWTNLQGKTVEAELMRTEGDKVVVKLPSGKEVGIALKFLSPRDREYVKKEQAIIFLEKAHIWTLPDGKLLNAILVSADDKCVAVADEEGKQVKIFISELNGDDKAFVEGAERKMDAGDEKKGNVPQANTISVDALADAIKRGNLKTVKSYIDRGGDVNAQQNGFSLLHIAAEANQFSIVKLLISGGADLEFQDQWGSSPLMRAAHKGYFDIVKILLASGAKLDVIHTDSGNTALMVAIEGNDPRVVKLMIDQGADVLAKNEKSGLTPTRVARANSASPAIRKMLEAAIAARKAKILAEGGSLPQDDGMLTPNEVIKAVDNNDKALLKEYIGKKGNLDVKGRENDWWSPLCLAAGDGKLDIVKMLLDGGANIEFPTTWGSTPLMCAVSGTRLDVVKLLLARGADVNATNDWGFSPIFDAVSSKNIQMVQLLIDNGAEIVTIREKSGSSLLQFAREKETPSHIIKLLESAVAARKARMKANGETVPEEDDTPTPGEVSVAMRKGDRGVVQKYIDRKSSLSARDRDGMSLLCVAAKLKKTDFLKMLLEAGADVEYPCENNRTAIGVAADNGNLEHVKILSESGANLDKDDNDRMLPVLCAINGNHPDIIKLLIAKGADIKNLPRGREEKDILEYARQHNNNAKIIKLLKDSLEKQGK